MVTRRMDGECIAMKSRQASGQCWRAIRPFGPIEMVEPVAIGGKVICQCLLVRAQNMDCEMRCLDKGVMAF